MADPMKTRIMKAIEERIALIQAVGTVKRNPSSPPRKETSIFPVVFLYDGIESKVRRNRYAMNVLPIQVETYFLAEEEDASDRADLIDCEIYKALLTDGSIKGLVQDIAPEEGNSTSKQFVDEYLAVVVSRYVVRYSHAWEDPTDQAK